MMKNTGFYILKNVPRLGVGKCQLMSNYDEGKRKRGEMWKKENGERYRIKGKETEKLAIQRGK
jgi:hypothetical protein